jgi:NADH:ubiquinone oxidoreductase subunit 6 (subunit J)
MKILQVIGVIIITFMVIWALVTIVLFIMGYRPIIDDIVRPDWEAINALGTWVVGFIIAPIISIVVVYLNKKIEKQNKTLILQQNEIEKLQKIMGNFNEEGSFEGDIDGGVL